MQQWCWQKLNAVQGTGTSCLHEEADARASHSPFLNLWYTFKWFQRLMLGHGIVIWWIKVTAHVAHIFNSDHTQCHAICLLQMQHATANSNFLLTHLDSCQLLSPQALELLYKFWQPADSWGCYSTLLTLSMDTANTSSSNDMNQKFVIVCSNNLIWIFIP